MVKLNKKRLLATIIIGLLALSAVVFVLVRSLSGSEKQTEKKQGATKTTTQHNGVSVTTSGGSDKASGSGSVAPGGTGATPAVPSGTFVSNHRPNLGGQPAPNQMNSICRTTPGATCEIQFTKDGVVKTLGPHTAGSDGYVSWDWKLQDIGLTEGTWQIEAVARNDDKIAGAKDPVALEVLP